MREIDGSGRLGPYVIERISKDLAGKGLGHYPSELPQNQWDEVRIYRLGSQIADLIAVATQVGNENDQRLRDLVSDDAARIIEQIRKLVDR